MNRMGQTLRGIREHLHILLPSKKKIRMSGSPSP